MKPVSDKQLVSAARKYNLDPGALKCRAFAWFDKGYSPKEVRYLLRHFRDPEYPQSFSNTIRKYHSLWRKAQWKLNKAGRQVTKPTPATQQDG